MAIQMESLIKRLNIRGISSAQIPGLIRDVFRVVESRGYFTTTLVNDCLQQLGWGQKVLDETSFQLIVYILESE
jgi:hypothetical protein